MGVEQWGQRLGCLMWGFPKIGGKPPKWMVKIMENPIKMDDLGVPLFSETSMYVCRTLYSYFPLYVKKLICFAQTWFHRFWGGARGGAFFSWRKREMSSCLPSPPQTRTAWGVDLDTSRRKDSNSVGFRFIYVEIWPESFWKKSHKMEKDLPIGGFSLANCITMCSPRGKTWQTFSSFQGAKFGLENLQSPNFCRSPCLKI